MYIVIKELSAYTKEGDATTELEGSFTSGPLTILPIPLLHRDWCIYMKCAMCNAYCILVFFTRCVECTPWYS